MRDLTNDIRLQSCLLILFSCCLLAGLLGLLALAFPAFPVPDGLRLSAEGAVAVMLGGVAMVALVLRLHVLRLIFGMLLAALSCYSLIHNVLAGFQDTGTSPLAGHVRLGFLPALSLLLLASVVLCGLDGRVTRLYAFLVGCFGVPVGVFVVASHLQRGLMAGPTGPVNGFTLIAGLLCLGFAIALLILSRRDPRSSFTLKRDGMLFGALGVLGTFVLVSMASWGANTERSEAAHVTLQHYNNVLEYRLEVSSGSIARLANRWASLDFNVPEELRQAEETWYFRDIPALQTLLVLDKDGSALWYSSRSVGRLSWLMDQVQQPAVHEWVNQIQSENSSRDWIFPDATRPFAGIVLVTPEASPDKRVVAVFDVDILLGLEDASFNDGFDIHLVAGVDETTSAPWFLSPPVNGVVAVGGVDESGLMISAVASPNSVLSLPGALPPALFAFGLLVSYLLVMGRSLLGVQNAQALQISSTEQRFRSLFFQSPDAVFAFDREGNYQAVNPVSQAIVGFSDADLGVTNYRDVLTSEAMHKADFAVFERAFQSTIGGESQAFEVGFINSDQQHRNYECAFMPIMVDGGVVGLFAVVKDVTERHAAQENQRILQKSLESSDNAVVVVDARDRSLPVVFVNPAFTEMTGYSEEEVLGSAVRRLNGPDTDPAEIARISATVKSGEATSATLKSYRRDGTPFWNQISLAPVKDGCNKVTHFTAIMSDISEKKEQEKRLAYQATHDVLTGLGNRTLFENRLEHDFALAMRGSQLIAVLFIDLDEFKPINDTLGHKVGDALLISVARRLADAVRPSDTLARFGGDEFVLLLPGLNSFHEAEEVAGRILSALTQAHHVGEHELYISASIGISFNGDSQEHPEKLLQQADMAMYKAKQGGCDTYEIYSEDLDSSLSKRLTLRNDLQEAIKGNHLYLNYQPQVNAAGQLCGMEALVRWKHPQKGFISPADFIPIAEETGQIVHLGKWITTQACEDARKLLEMGVLRGRMSVNLSPLQFHRPGFLGILNGILEKTGLPARYLELELTEGILMKDSDSAISIMHAINDLGVAMAIDDFGTGFSSFGYLKDLPVDNIKIDRSFVEHVVTNEKDAAVCKGMIALARELGLKVVAEGVETIEQFNYLKANGCEVFQGYYFARPMSLDQLIDWIGINLNGA